MEQLLAAARRLPAGRPDDHDVSAVRDAVRYFENAVRRHFLDEEGSVFPRLSTRRPELADALAQLSAEHPPQVGLQNAIAEAARELDDDSRPGAGKQLLELAERLAELHHAHVAREDELFAGVAAAALTAEDDTEISAEMETRRDRDGHGGGRRRDAGPTKMMKPVKQAAKSVKNTSAKSKPAAAKKTSAKSKPAAAKKTSAKSKPAAAKKTSAKSKRR
jgi:hemerythrin-like domain-containing protein